MIQPVLHCIDVIDDCIDLAVCSPTSTQPTALCGLDHAVSSLASQPLALCIVIYPNSTQLKNKHVSMDKGFLFARYHHDHIIVKSTTKNVTKEIFPGNRVCRLYRLQPQQMADGPL